MGMCKLLIKFQLPGMGTGPPFPPEGGQPWGSIETGGLCCFPSA